MAALVGRRIAAIDPDQPISDVQPMDRRIARSLVGRRFTLMFLGSFAGFALALAAIGIYAVVAFSVQARTHEIGVRMALGARPRDVLGMVVRQAMTTAALGTALGLAGAFGLTRVIAGLLYGVSPFDRTTFAVIPAGLLTVALVAAYVPARRATLVDPTDALRIE
jgi:putative ABC transport system permease protein